MFKFFDRDEKLLDRVKCKPVVLHTNTHVHTFLRDFGLSQSQSLPKNKYPILRKTQFLGKQNQRV